MLPSMDLFEGWHDSCYETAMREDEDILAKHGEYSTKMERILIIDDETSILKALQIGLASDNYEVDLADDGISGIHLGQTQVYDILIVDLALPDMNGLEVVKTIKSSAPDIVPIIITGQASMRSSVEALRLEVCDYLEKPLSLPAVKSAIARGLEKRKLRQRIIESNTQQNLLSDSLTGLADRSLFMDHLSRVIAGTERNQSCPFALLLMDIDHFKGVNDTYGHHAGDRVLSLLANRFKACVRPSDTVARMNGDEFAVLIEGVGSEQFATRVAERCQRAAADALEFDGQKINLSVSIGLVTKTSNYQSPDDVLRDADMALSRCKEQGGGFIKYFDRNMLEEAIDSLQLENDLRLALQNHEFVLHYQPIVRLKDMQTIGLEALIRWNHPEQGTIYPAEFIPKAEEIGLIHEIGNWVLNEGCRQYNKWQQTIPSFKNLSLSINISRHQFGQAGFADKVAWIIADNALNPSVLKFEIRESTLMERSSALIENLAVIKNIGVKLALDDFGAGYSSFSYLHQLPLDELKIGKSIIQNLDFNSESYEVVKAIVTLAKKFGLKVLAEGVETEAHYNCVKRLDFDMVQGFWFGQSVTEGEIFRCLRKLNNGN